MIGVDLGVNVGSVIRLKKRGGKWVVVNSHVMKFTHEKENKFESRIYKIAGRYVETIVKMAKKGERVFIEEPVFSWGRKNPKVFATGTALITMIFYMLKVLNSEKAFRIRRVNNKSAKLAAGYGGKDKEGMIKAYKKTTGALPGHSTKYGKETLADSYFIAMAGYNATLRDR